MTKLRDNEFRLSMTGLSDLSFDIDDHCITKGQPWEGIECIETDETGATIVVGAGRSKSTEVAHWFKSAIKPGSAIACDSYDGLPGKLNFAFMGTMSFQHKGKTYTGQKIVLAQGSNARLRNNWWLGGPNVSEITSWGTALAAAAQTFDKQGVAALPAKVIFASYLGKVSEMKMGIIDL